MIDQSIRNLEEIKDLLMQLSQEQYSHKSAIMSFASIGQHVRHVLEFYQCLFEAGENGIVNYDNRQRNLKLETDIEFSIDTISGIVNKLLAVEGNFPVRLSVNYSLEDDTTEDVIKTSFYRELAYNTEHTIHHQALIKVAVNDMQSGLIVSDSFGIAPSTFRHKNSVCVQ